MAIITLLTDFGTDAEYVGVMKGVILTIHPRAAVVDISHAVEPQDVAHAAWLLESAWEYFPKGSIHTVVVDPGVGGERAIIAFRHHDHTFLAPDNGVLTPVLEKAGTETVVRVENPRYFLHPVSGTFHGRDIFAPVAAHLSAGLPVTRLGSRMGPGDLTRLALEKPCIDAQGQLIGSILTVDRFGNLITNVHLRDLEHHFSGVPRKRLDICIGDHRLGGLHARYGEVARGEALALIGSRGCIEVAVNCGSAARRLAVGRGDRVRIAFDAKPGMTC